MIGGPQTYLTAVTVLEVIQRSTAFLTKKGVESPRLQAELLLAHLLGLPRMQLYLNFERQLTTPEQDRLRQMIKRRGDREPLQHIVGTTSFCGLEIQVSGAALIPRPETELLAEHGWIFLNQVAERTTKSTSPSPPQNNTSAPQGTAPAALDFGTGTGCLAIALSVKCQAARLVALDVDPQALKLAQQNAARHGVSQRIEFIGGDGLSALPKGVSFDLILANPPYIPSHEIATLEPEVRDHDPRRALDGGADGLDFFRSLASQAKPLLKPEGKMMLEFGDGQAEPLQKLFVSENWIVEPIVSDYTQRPRILIAHQRT